MRIEADPGIDASGARGHSQGDPSTGAAGAQPDNVALETSLAEFRAALDQRKIEPICAAYQALRSAAGKLPLPELLRRARKGANGDVLGTLASAYSHLPCFMCGHGTVACDPCGGSGKLGDRQCPHCDGFGLAPCGFCRGTGWADRDIIPPELKLPVLRRQLKRARIDVSRLGKTLAGITKANLPAIDPGHRRRLAAWMMRLRARLTDLAANEAASNDQQQAHLINLAGRIDAGLDMLV